MTPIEEVIGQTGRGGAAVPSLRRKKEERRCLLEALASLYVQGRVPDWRRLHPTGGRCVTLPLYPWQRRRYWINQDEPHPPGTGERDPAEDWLETARGRRQDLVPQFPARLKSFLGAQLAAVLALPKGEVRPDVSFRSLGMDSLGAGRLRSRINVALGVSLSLITMWKFPTIEMLTEHLLVALGAPLTAPGEGETSQESDPGPGPARRAPDGERRALVALGRRPGVKMRLFCFPYMGGGAHAFAEWKDRLPEGVELWAFQPSGRHDRADEPAHTSMTAVIDELSLGIQPLLDRPFAFYGHSFGAAVAYELARRLRREGLALPVHLFVGAAPAPHVSATANLGLANLDESTIMSLLNSLGGVPEELFQDPRTRQEILKSLRGDFLMLDGYVHQPEPPLPCPISVYAGQDDPMLEPDGLDGWRHYTSARWHRHTMPGGHLFLLSHMDELLHTLVEELSHCQGLA